MGSEAKKLINSKIISISKPQSEISEAYRTLRTNIAFSSLKNKLQVIVVTSAAPNEGKTITAANLAVAMANVGKKTILIDTDLRKPMQHKLFNCSNYNGLTNLLIDEAKFEEVIYKSEVENLYILPCGTRPPNPSELIGSTKMENLINDLRQSFECVILDTPPVTAVTDAQVLSNFVDGYILVIASGITEKRIVIKAKDLLNKVDARILGLVLNKVEDKKGIYGYKYNYNYYNEKEKTDKKERKRRKKKVQDQPIQATQ